MPIYYDEQAKRDLNDIWRYIAADSPKRATSFVRKLKIRLTIYEAFPDLGRLYEVAGNDVRYFSFGDYLVFYHVNLFISNKKHKAASDIVIDRVLHCKMRISAEILEDGD